MAERNPDPKISKANKATLSKEPATETGTVKKSVAEKEQLISMNAKELLAFWEALSAPVQLTPAQEKLGALMRGEE